MVEAVWSRPPLDTPDARKDFIDLIALCELPEKSCRIQVDTGQTVITFADGDGRARRHAEELLDRAYELAAAERPKQPTVLLDLLDATPPARAGGRDQFISLRPGLWAGRAALAELLRRLDSLFLGLALEQGAEEYAAPHLIPWTSLQRAGYVAAFPQHISACYSVRPSLDDVDTLGATTDLTVADTLLEPGGLCLSPAACYHLYPMFADTIVEPGRLMTVMAHCSRRELKWTPQPIRFHSFRMRELVFVGSRAHTLAFRDRQLELCQDLARRMDLPCRVVTATDPFFTSSRQPRIKLQNTLDLKHELLARDADGNDFAVTSVNFHFDHIGRAFNMLSDGSPAQSSCLAFGLDRWAHWILSHCGPDPENWPEPLRDPAPSFVYS
ncbi:hypothetical protein [Nocardia wallacei]|uniref:hypothetical protein n=1 Tax=Nocardia wallacei TaxID=480035 RepID=UPI002459073A|nr:hypothetical protein [Nocardia wallacei]